MTAKLTSKAKSQFALLEARVEFLEKVLERGAFKLGLDMSPIAAPRKAVTYPFAVGRSDIKSWIFWQHTSTWEAEVSYDCICGVEHKVFVSGIPQNVKPRFKTVLTPDPESTSCRARMEVEITKEDEWEIQERLKKCQSGAAV